MSIQRLSGFVRFLLVLPILISGVASGASITIPVNCDGNLVGNITVTPFTTPTGNIGGMDAKFVSIVGTPPSLAAAAALCGEDHFNWYQVVTADSNPPKDAKGNPVTPPYVDPPPGGYAADPTQTPPFPVLWADNLPWYYNEGPPPPPGTPGYEPGNNLSSQVSGDTLFFEDLPNAPRGTNLSFSTWLVSLNADGSFHEFHGGFSWTWGISAGGVVTVGEPVAINVDPTAAQYQNIIGGFATKIVPLPPAVVPGVVVVVGGVIVSRVRGRKA